MALHDQREASFAGATGEVQAWIEEVTSRRFEKPFAEQLKDGTVLCELINRIQPGTIPERTVSRGSTVPFRQLENISLFLRAAKSIGGLRDFECFDAADLGRADGLPRVVMCLYALGAAVRKKPGYDGPKLVGGGGGAPPPLAAAAATPTSTPTPTPTPMQRAFLRAYFSPAGAKGGEDVEDRRGDAESTAPPSEALPSASRPRSNTPVVPAARAVCGDQGPHSLAHSPPLGLIAEQGSAARADAFARAIAAESPAAPPLPPLPGAPMLSPRIARVLALARLLTIRAPLVKGRARVAYVLLPEQSHPQQEAMGA